MYKLKVELGLLLKVVSIVNLDFLYFLATIVNMDFRIIEEDDIKPLKIFI